MGKRVALAPGDGDEQENPLIASDEAEAAYVDLGKLVEILEPGDHIATTRNKGIYEHHGIYGGMPDGYPSAIHLKAPASRGRGPALSEGCPKCGHKDPKYGGVACTCLDCFSLGQNTYKLQYKLQQGYLTKEDPNWNQLIPGHVIKEYRKKSYYLELYKDGQLYGHLQVGKKWRHSYKLEDRVRFYKNSSDRSGWEVFDAAQSMVGQLVGEYDLRKKNCEHFAVFCKTGKGKSLQTYKFFKSLFCNMGQVASPLAYERIIQNGSKTMNRKKRDYSEHREASEGDEGDEKALLKSDEYDGRRKPSKIVKILRKMFCCCV